MTFNQKHIFYLLILQTMLLSCAPSRHYLTNYYKENEKKINAIEEKYSSIYPLRPLAAEFTDKNFSHISLEIKTDSLRYIFEFSLTDQLLKDNLRRFGYDTASVMQLFRDMKQVKCTWINTLDYYVDGRKRLLTFMSIRHKALDIPFSPKKYFILTFYHQPQYYDAEGRLLDKRNVRRIRKVNNEIFWRINDRVCYTLSAKFR